MTASVAALVEKAIFPVPTLDGLWSVYRGYEGRPLTERRRVKAILATRLDSKPLLDTEALYSLPEARNSHTNLPVLAVAPIRSRRVYFSDQGRWAGFSTGRFTRNFLEIPPRAKRRAVDEPVQELAATAPVPPVPKSLMPVMPWTRRKCYVLFDADWKALPVDPYLLERVTSTQFRILAHWDLTDQERELMKIMGLDRE